MKINRAVLLLFFISTGLFLVTLLFYKPIAIKMVDNLTVSNSLKEYKAKITSSFKNLNIQTGEKIEIPISIKDISKVNWMVNGLNPIRLNYRTINKRYGITTEDVYLDLAHDIRAGETVSIKVTYQAPQELDYYYIDFDLVQEGITYFKDADSKDLVVNIKVIDNK